MKPRNPRFLTSLNHFRHPSPALGLAVAVSSLAVQFAHAETNWTGTVDQDWTNASNWSNGVPVENGAQGQVNINIATGNFPTITTAGTYQGDWDIVVGGGSNGRLDQSAGTLATGEGNWFFLGWAGAQATYNLTGSGSLKVGGLTTPNGNLIMGLDNSTVSTMNINTSGTVQAGGLWVAANGATTGIVNLDSGTVNVSGEAQIGSSFWGNGGSGQLNMTGGTFTANILSFARGNNNSAVITGTTTISGGTLNSQQYFTMGFAGSSSNVGTVTNNGGTINVNTSGGGQMELGVWDPSVNTINVNSGAVTLQNNASIQFGVLGHSGQSTVNQNGGTVTFYSDAGLTVGGTGGVVLGSQGVNPWEISSGTYNYNLNGGTLTAPKISKVSANATGAFNFNGGTLKAAGSTTTFMQGLTAANVQNGGAVIDSNGYNVTVGQALLDGGTGGLTKQGAGTLTLAGANTYTGNTTVNAGQLTLADNSAVKFVVGSVGVNNQITGTGTIQLDGDFTIDTTGASTTLGDSWTLVDFGTLTETIGTTFSVTGWIESSPGVWQSPTAPFRYTETTGVLQVVVADLDGDGLADAWEQQIIDADSGDGITTINDVLPGDDFDGDGSTNAQEALASTDPVDPAYSSLNIDGDGLADLWEDQHFGDNDGIVETSDLTPQDGSGDPDGDLATNLMEYNGSSDPMSLASWPDTDSDTMNDGWETVFFTNLAKDGTADTDGDGFTDLQEHAAHTDPSVATGSGVSPIWTTLKHRWSFNGNLNDSVGTSNATIVEVGANGVTQDPTSITITGGDRAASDYVKLGENLLPKNTTPVTIELWAKQNTIQYWSRIFDFHSSNAEYLMMAWTRGTDNATDQVEIVDGGVVSSNPDKNQPYGITDEYHIVMTLEPLAGAGETMKVTFYSAASSAANLGAPKGTIETTINLVKFNDALCALGYSAWGGDNTANATYNEVRIWNGALSGWMLEKMHELGPDSVTVADADGDHLPDDWEAQYSFDVTTLNGNDDGDTFSNYEEYVAGSNPNSTSSVPEDIDGDGLADLWEDQYFGDNNGFVETSDLTPQIGSGDPDGDLLDNEYEETNNSDPTDDEDGLLTAWEVFFFGSSTTQSGADDSDGDGFTNEQEENVSQPNNIASTPTDVNGDGIADTAQHTLAFEDVLGTTSFNAALNWNDALAPAAGQTYIVPVASLRTPAGVGDYTFAGARLDFIEVYTGKPTLVVKNDGITTIPFLTLNGSRINHAATTGFVNTIAGAIDIRGPFGSEILAGNGSLIINAAISGSSQLNLTGGNTVTLAGVNTHTGNLNSTGGGLILSSSGSLKFVPVASGVNNAITGTSAATLNGTFNIDTTGASTASGSTWDLITTSGAVTIGANFTVTGFTADAGAIGARIWTSGSYQYAEATGVLSVGGADPDSDDDGMEDAWESTYFGGLTQGAADDFDGDDTDNLTEYRLGLVPNSGTSRFAVTRNATTGLLTWPSLEGVTFRIERSTTLGTWTVLDAAYPAAVSPATTTTYTDGSAPAGKAFYRVGLNP